jgi:hypothetical protein
MEKELYINLRQQIIDKLPDIQHVALWNNQFNRSNGNTSDTRVEKPFNYPCVFIEFAYSEFRQLSLGVQEFDLEVILHLGFKSYETEDLDILDLKQRLYYWVQRFQQGNFARLSRVSETWDYDHDNITELIMQFHTRAKDTSRYVLKDNILGTQSVDLVLTSDIVDVITATSSSNNTDNGANLFTGTIPTDPGCN